MSCIALSVGLGNVWRFPFTALDNGGGVQTFVKCSHSLKFLPKFIGGAFVIPYVIVLFLVGKPVYYLEMVIGQFSSRSSIKAFDVCPITRGMFVGSSKLNLTTRIYLGLSFTVLRDLKALLNQTYYRNWCWAGSCNSNGNWLLCLPIGNYNSVFCCFVLCCFTLELLPI